MRISQWGHFLSLPVWLRLACAEAASPDGHDSHNYDSSLGGDQKVLTGLCPDYTSYARHRQYVIVLSTPPHLTNIMTANHSAKGLYNSHTNARTHNAANSALQPPRK